MKKVVSFVVLLLLVTSVKASNWSHDLEAAKKMAIASNKLIFVDFTASWCGPCKRMERESWSNEEVGKMMNNYVPVQLDLDYNRNLAQKYGVRGIPNLLILDANGKVLFQEMSYKTKSQVLKLLEKYALNTEFLQNEYALYYKKKNIITAYRLANKLQEYSLYLKDGLRRDYLSLANEYIVETKKYAKEAEAALKKSVNKKINFLNIKGALYKGKGKKALKLLSKIDASELDEYSFAQYSYLNYAAYKTVKDEVNAQKWAQKLNETGKAAPYLKKMELLFS